MQVISITGAAGFIGTHLIKEINKESYKINLLSRKKISDELIKKKKHFQKKKYIYFKN